jgi:hypothetical protein
MFSVFIEHSLPNMNGETTKQHRRQPRLCLGDLNSGRAFDNYCLCFESVNGFRRRECTCNVNILTHLYFQFDISFLSRLQN